MYVSYVLSYWIYLTTNLHSAPNDLQPDVVWGFEVSPVIRWATLSSGASAGNAKIGGGSFWKEH